MSLTETLSPGEAPMSRERAVCTRGSSSSATGPPATAESARESRCLRGRLRGQARTRISEPAPTLLEESGSERRARRRREENFDFGVQSEYSCNHPIPPLGCLFSFFLSLVTAHPGGLDAISIKVYL